MATEPRQDNPVLTGQQKEKMKKAISRYEMRDWAEALLTAGTVVVFVLLFICQIVVVDGESMEPNFHTNERLLALSSFGELERNDVVCIKRDDDAPLIKRVIATEGQTVDIDTQAGIVYVDGEPLEESFTLEPTYTDGNSPMTESIGFPATVPEDCVFVMGDNRNNSLDSRFEEVGMVHLDHVFGKVVFRLYPFDEIGPITLPEE